MNFDCSEFCYSISYHFSVTVYTFEYYQRSNFYSVDYYNNDLSGHIIIPLKSIPTTVVYQATKNNTKKC